MRDNRCIIHQVSNVVDDGYKIEGCTSAEFKVFPPHMPYKSEYRIVQFRRKEAYEIPCGRDIHNGWRRGDNGG